MELERLFHDEEINLGNQDKLAINERENGKEQSRDRKYIVWNYRVSIYIDVGNLRTHIRALRKQGK